MDQSKDVIKSVKKVEVPATPVEKAENDWNKADNLKGRKPRRSSRSPVPKKAPEDDKSLDPVTKLILAKKITEFSAEHGRDPAKDEIEQMFEATIRILAGELVDESFICDHSSELTEDHIIAEELVVGTADQVLTANAPAVEPVLVSTPAQPQKAISDPLQPTSTESTAEAAPAKSEPKETEQAFAKASTDERRSQESDSKIAEPKDTEVKEPESEPSAQEEEQSSPNNMQPPPQRETDAVVDDLPREAAAAVIGTEMAINDTAEQSGSKKRKRDVSTEDIESMKKPKIDEAVGGSETQVV